MVFGEQVSGTIRIADPLPDQMSAIMLNLSFATSHPEMMSQLQWRKQDDSLWLAPPASRSFSDKRCMAISATFHVAPEARLQTLAISSENLGFQTMHSSNFSVEDTILRLTSGGVNCTKPLNSRRTIIDNTAGSITGTFSTLR